MSRRVAVLSPGGELVHHLLAALAERGIELDALVLYVPGVPRYWRRLESARARLLALPLLPARWAGWRLRVRMDARLRRGARRVIFTGPLNGVRMERHLRRLDPHVLVLAGCGLLDPHILGVPREGTVGVHPALLPWVRGNGAIENSILGGVPLGCTAFRVDPGIDTGPVLERRLVR
ncbi:MAG TPA: formyltransferase family protein, partial [Longimicrobium sp.]|nr:formyltransferase family protein [Longimicrobium sp.]